MAWWNALRNHLSMEDGASQTEPPPKMESTACGPEDVFSAGKAEACTQTAATPVFFPLGIHFLPNRHTSTPFNFLDFIRTCPRLSCLSFWKDHLEECLVPDPERPGLPGNREREGYSCARCSRKWATGTSRRCNFAGTPPIRRKRCQKKRPESVLHFELVSNVC